MVLYRETSTLDLINTIESQLKAYFGSDYQGLTYPPLVLYFSRELLAAELTYLKSKTNATVAMV